MLFVIQYRWRHHGDCRYFLFCVCCDIRMYYMSIICCLIRDTSTHSIYFYCIFVVRGVSAGWSSENSVSKERHIFRCRVTESPIYGRYSIYSGLIC